MSAVIVPNVRTVVAAVPRGPGSERQATILFLWMSSPQHRSKTTSIAHPFLSDDRRGGVRKRRGWSARSWRQSVVPRDTRDHLGERAHGTRLSRSPSARQDRGRIPRTSIFISRWHRTAVSLLVKDPPAGSPYLRLRPNQRMMRPNSGRRRP